MTFQTFAALFISIFGAEWIAQKWGFSAERGAKAGLCTVRDPERGSSTPKSFDFPE